MCCSRVTSCPRKSRMQWSRNAWYTSPNSDSLSGAETSISHTSAPIPCDSFRSLMLIDAGPLALGALPGEELPLAAALDPRREDGEVHRAAVRLAHAREVVGHQREIVDELDL